MRTVSIALALLISTASFGQSLGDVARENREEKEKQKAASALAAQPRVITNKDLPQDPEQTEDILTYLYLLYCKIYVKDSNQVCQRAAIRCYWQHTRESIILALRFSLIRNKRI